MKVDLDTITLPLRAGVLLALLGSAYFFGFPAPFEEWRKSSAETGTVARYSRNGRPWRIYYDRNLDRRWDMWIDERGGPPLIVSVDDDGDGEPERERDEFGNPLSPWRSAQLKADKTLVEFFHNPAQLSYTGIAVAVYMGLEFVIRVLSRR